MSKSEERRIKMMAEGKQKAEEDIWAELAVAKKELKKAYIDAFIFILNRIKKWGKK